MTKFFIVCLIAVSSIAFTQESFVSMNFGTSIPLGDYSGRKDITKQGFAMNGGVGEIFGGFAFSDYISGVVSVKFSSNFLDNDRARYALEEFVRESVPGEIPEGVEGDFRLGWWKNFSFMVGPQFNYEIKKLTFDAYLLVGFNICTSPDMEVVIVNQNNTYQAKFSAQNFSFAFSPGAALRYQFSSKYALRLAYDYTLAKSDGEIKSNFDSAISGTRVGDYDLKVQNMHITIGVVYGL